MNSLKLIALNFTIPIVVGIFFFLLNIYQTYLSDYILSILPFLFYLLAAIVLVVSWHFNRTKFIFAILPLILFYASFSFLPQDKSRVVFELFSFIYPVHLLIFLLFKERGIFTLWGYLKVLFFLVEVGIVAWFVEFPNQLLAEILGAKIFAFNLIPLSDISFVIGVVVLLVMLLLVLFGHLLIYYASYVVILISFYLGFYFVKYPHALEHSFITIELIVLVLLVREAYRLAYFDELTSLPGRRALIEDMAKLGRKYSLAMVDIDFFKKFNDTYGHDTGDEVLKMVATKLAKVGGGKAYRYGGEEFTILFPSRELDESYIFADILRENIATSPFIVRGKKANKKIFINISVGIVQSSSKDNDPFDAMKRADKALYKAKEGGRNRVVKVK